MDNMEKKIVKQLNWYYYGIMVFSVIVLTVMFLLRDKEILPHINYLSQRGVFIQYFVIFDALITIPLGLYLVKWRKTTDLNKYRKLATWRILLVGNSMPLGIAAHYLMGTPQYRAMFWVAAVAAVAWYFTKPTIGKLEKETTIEDPNTPTY